MGGLRTSTLELLFRFHNLAENVYYFNIKETQSNSDAVIIVISQPFYFDLLNGKNIFSFLFV